MDKNISFKFDFIIYSKESNEFLDLDKFIFSMDVKNELLKEFCFTKTSNSWSIKSNRVYSFYLQESLRNFLDITKLNSCSPLLGYSEPDFEKRLFIKAEIFKDEIMPSFSLELDILEFLHKHACTIDIDLYDYRKK